MTRIIHGTGVGVTHGAGDGLSEFPSDLADVGTAGSAVAFSVQASDTSALVTLASCMRGSDASALPMRVLVAGPAAAVADSRSSRLLFKATVTEATAIDRIWSDRAGFPPPGGRRRKPNFARERGRDGRAAAGIDARRGCRDERLLRGMGCHRRQQKRMAAVVGEAVIRCTSRAARATIVPGLDRPRRCNPEAGC